MKALLLLCTLALCSASMAQTDSVAYPKRLAIGVTFSPDYSYRSLRTKSTDPTTLGLRDARNGSEFPILGYTTGITAQYRITKRFALQLAALYAVKGEEVRQSSPNGLIATPDPSLPISSQIQYNYRYVDFPVNAMYYVSDKKLQLFVSAGLGPGIKLGHKIYYQEKYDDGREFMGEYAWPLAGLRNVMLNVQVGLGVDWYVSNDVYIRLAPEFRHATTNLVVGSTLRQYPYSVGANGGIFVQL